MKHVVYNICMYGIIFLMPLLNVAAAPNIFPADTLAYRQYWNPHWHHQVLNYCLIHSHNCGKIVADKYCKTMGYAYADQFVKANSVGLTHYIDQQARCRGWQCSGFSMIRCVKQITHDQETTSFGQYKRFYYPRYHHYRVDWCYKQNACGARAAYSFCRRMGYAKTISFVKTQKVTATQTIGTQKLCFGAHCHGFYYIACSR